MPVDYVRLVIRDGSCLPAPKAGRFGDDLSTMLDELNEVLAA